MTSCIVLNSNISTYLLKVVFIETKLRRWPGKTNSAIFLRYNFPKRSFACVISAIILIFFFKATCVKCSFTSEIHFWCKIFSYSHSLIDAHCTNCKIYCDLLHVGNFNTWQQGLCKAWQVYPTDQMSSNTSVSQLP